MKANFQTPESYAGLRESDNNESHVFSTFYITILRNKTIGVCATKNSNISFRDLRV
jgi:hypothetical protein